MNKEQTKEFMDMIKSDKLLEAKAMFQKEMKTKVSNIVDGLRKETAKQFFDKVTESK